MQHETFPDFDTAQPADAGITTQARAGLAGIVSSIDSRFMPAGQTLGQLVETIGAVLAGLDVVEQALGQNGGGESGDAAQALLNAAQQLREVPARQAERSARIAVLATLMKRLATLSAEIEHILKVMDFYAVNLKIVTAGTDGFSEFAEDMSAKLKLGGSEVAAFKKQMSVMSASLADMLQIDALLSQECARVIPAVPDRLVAEVGHLRQRQGWLAQASFDTRQIVLRVQTRVGAALGAIQIGDITRQRLEHVLDGCRAFDERAADPTMPDPEGTRGHMLRLFSDQLTDLGQDFSVQTQDLRQALDALAPDCETLLGQSRQDVAIRESGQFLRELSQCIGELNGVAGQLHRADSKALEITKLVLSGVSALQERALVIEGLRYDVDYMAINVNIQARRDAQIGRPVGVIADEIRLTSFKLAGVVASIGEATDELGQVSGSFDTHHHDETGPGVGEALETALSIISQGAGQAEEAITSVEERAKGIANMICGAQDELEICGELTQQLTAMAQGLNALAASAQVSILADQPHPAQALMADMARSYTMHSERLVHDRHLLPGMDPASITGATTMPSYADDDAMFDDALF